MFCIIYVLYCLFYYQRQYQVVLFEIITELQWGPSWAPSVVHFSSLFHSFLNGITREYFAVSFGNVVDDLWIYSVIIGTFCLNYILLWMLQFRNTNWCYTILRKSESSNINALFTECKLCQGSLFMSLLIL